MNTPDPKPIEHPIGRTGKVLPNFLLIEERIVQALKNANPNLDIQEFEFGAFPTNLKHIAINVDTAQVDAKSKSMNALEITSQITLTILVFRATDPKRRREIAFPLVYGVLKLLSFQDLGLEMKRMKPEGIRNATTEELSKAGFLAYQAKFSTSWTIKMETEEEATQAQADDAIRDLSAGPVGDLLKIAIDYIETETNQRTIDNTIVEVGTN